MGMNRELFFPKSKKSKWQKVLAEVLASLIYLILLCVIAVSIGAGIAYAAFWWKETVFIDRLTLDYKLHSRYSDGKYHERLCKQSESFKFKSVDMEELCKAHNSTNFPKGFLSIK